MPTNENAAVSGRVAHRKRRGSASSFYYDQARSPPIKSRNNTARRHQDWLDTWTLLAGHALRQENSYSFQHVTGMTLAGMLAYAR